MRRKIVAPLMLAWMLFVLGAVAACDSKHTPAGEVAGGTHPSRPAVDSLDSVIARSRSDRVSNVSYELHINLDKNRDTFSGLVTIRFSLSNAATDLTIDYSGGMINSLGVNDQLPVINHNGFFLTLPADVLQTGANELTITFEHAYSRDGTGLHRFVDPEDGRTYLYSYLWPYYANRLFPLFDQPNIKATMSLTVRAPNDWVVVSTGTAEVTEESDGKSLWTFATTPKMSSYVFSLHAGPYTVWEADADGIPIRLMARQSLAEFVAVEEWFDITRRGLEFFGNYFEIPYPFGKYDQLIVPDFNIGAMENIAAVTFAEHYYVQRQDSDRAEREQRAGTILHEMAHMWFGDLVTHDWWNGLWLNESFATQMAAVASVATTEFTDTWHGFFVDDKKRAYHRDAQVTTHPIEMPIDSTADFFSVFDAITYQKGASVLKQLAHYVGEERYRLGVSAYLKKHAYSTTSLQDFIDSQALSSGINLDQWAEQWLYRPGFNTLGVIADCREQQLRSLKIRQTAPEGRPYLRAHQIDIALYFLTAAGQVSPAEVLSAEVGGEETAVVIPADTPCPAMINPNHNDWAYARINLDERTAAHLDQHLGNVPDPLARSIFLSALLDRALAGEMKLAEYLQIAMRLAEHEQNIRVQQQISVSLVETIDLMRRLRPESNVALTALIPELEQQALEQMTLAQTADLKRIWLGTFLGVVSSEAGRATVAALLDGTQVIDGLDISADVRWKLLTILGRYDAADIDQRLAAELASDQSDFGVKNALTVDAIRADVGNKAKWLGELQKPQTLTGLSKQRAVMAGMFPANQTALQLELLDEVLNALPALSSSTDPYFMSSYASDLLRPMCTPQSEALLQQALIDQSTQLNSTALRFLREAQQADQECLALRALQ
jgi:aminopeptidase N